MEYADFYDIAEYGNKAWKGSFTQKEIACIAHDYTVEFKESKETEKPTHTIKELYKLLVEDGTEECIDWAYNIANELDLFDMDYTDFTETDSELIRKLMEYMKEGES